MATHPTLLSQESFEVNVKDFHGSSVVIKVLPEWNVGMVKQEIANRTSIDPREFRIVFAGQTLEDGARLWVCACVHVCDIPNEMSGSYLL